MAVIVEMEVKKKKKRDNNLDGKLSSPARGKSFV